MRPLLDSFVDITPYQQLVWPKNCDFRHFGILPTVSTGVYIIFVEMFYFIKDIELSFPINSLDRGLCNIYMLQGSNTKITLPPLLNYFKRGLFYRNCDTDRK